MKYRKKPVVIEAYQTDKELDIETLEGTMHASVGDYIITGIRGEQYPCKPDIFEQTYEPADAPTASPWHSMEDNGPPEENGPYFVYAPSYRGGSSSGKESARGVMISKWTGKHWSIEVGYYKRPGCVTHWMPIEPPKED